MHGHHRCLTEAVCIAAQRAAAKAQSSSSKKKTVVLQETGFTNLGPCNIYIYIYTYIYVCVYVVLKVNSFLANLCSIPPRKLQQIPMVVLLQQSVPPIYLTCFSKKYSMKLRLLSRTWPNTSKLEHTVLILRPSMFIAAVVTRLVPASLNA